jgi:hypothetical protein
MTLHWRKAGQYQFSVVNVSGADQIVAVYSDSDCTQLVASTQPAQCPPYRVTGSRGNQRKDFYVKGLGGGIVKIQAAFIPDGQPSPDGFGI